MINIVGVTDEGFTGTIAASARIISEKTVNSSLNNSDSVRTNVKQPAMSNLQAIDSLRANWSEWTGGHIYSYRIVLKANKKDVRKWDISFDSLPEGTKIKEPGSMWTKIIQDGSADGKIILGTPDNDKYMVKAGASLDIDLQLHYPNQSAAYEKLQNLTAREYH